MSTNQIYLAATNFGTSTMINVFVGRLEPIFKRELGALAVARHETECVLIVTLPEYTKTGNLVDDVIDGQRFYDRQGRKVAHFLEDKAFKQVFPYEGRFV